MSSADIDISQPCSTEMLQTKMLYKAGKWQLPCGTPAVMFFWGDLASFKRSFCLKNLDGFGPDIRAFSNRSFYVEYRRAIRNRRPFRWIIIPFLSKFLLVPW